MASASALNRGNAIYSSCFAFGMYSVHSCACAPRMCLASAGVSDAGTGSKAYAESIGFESVASGPLVRSSYHADLLAGTVKPGENSKAV